MRRVILICLVVFFFYSGYTAWTYIHDISIYQDAIAGKYFFSPPTKEEMAQWNIKDKQFEIKQAQEQLEQIKQGKSEWEHDFINKQARDLQLHIKEYPKGHNPPHNILLADLEEFSAKRDKWVFATVTSFALTIYILTHSSLIVISGNQMVLGGRKCNH